MDFLYFPEDKSEYIPGIISVVIIFILSILIVRLLTKASRKQVKKLNEQGYPVIYDRGEMQHDSDGQTQSERQATPNTPEEPKDTNGPPTKKP
ncbi:hypothetical protein BBI15_13490 [Planococcus plakortidis]|uniref:Uncharacterized protein n=1 Tax=Planococcus plakortidis TaxID=1038856 RepID=A0A1C7EBQ3_9BACL|nr:hypothetical protein [Planococcus plakortidis]ANU21125.1 hypothetical protein BBI15_13490 [Planococcus plakortidis]